MHEPRTRCRSNPEFKNLFIFILMLNEMEKTSVFLIICFCSIIILSKGSLIIPSCIQAKEKTIRNCLNYFQETLVFCILSLQFTVAENTTGVHNTGAHTMGAHTTGVHTRGVHIKGKYKVISFLA